MKKGVLLIAIGNPIYIKMAYNLALSIRANEPMINITLIHDDSISKIDDICKTVFNKLIPTQETNPFYLKLTINQLTPYDKTIYLDADMVNVKGFSIATLFDQPQPFVIANRGIILHNDWEQVDEPTLNVSSEFIYFEKCEKVDKIFNNAIEHYVNDYEGRTIGGFRPDEPSIVHGIKSIKYKLKEMPYHPTYWVGNSKVFVSAEAIKKTYPFLSMGGNRIELRIQQLYDSIMKHYGFIMSMPYYKHQNKNTITARKLI
jgi:hypothetical protein